MASLMDNELAELKVANAALTEALAARTAELARCRSDYCEALEQQAATAEILEVINTSAGDLAPVFDAILEKAHTLCGAAYGGLLIREGEDVCVVAAHGEAHFVEACRQLRPGRPPAGSLMARLMGGEIRIVHVADVRDDSYHKMPAEIRRLYELGGIRTFMMVPLRKDDGVLGVITAFRQEVRPFTDKQIALLENFAAQAVIAMENARLMTETREALEQQTATAEVLQVINSSPGDLGPVFDAILEKAHLLCGAAKGSLVTYDGEHFRTAAMRGLSPRYAAMLWEARDDHSPLGSPPQRLVAGENIVHVPDFREVDFPIPRAAAELEGARTVLFVPLRRDTALLGYITAYRQEVRPFSDKQIALLQNFAAQAVIAIENARLINETREALEQQTATAEVLQVINSSPGDLGPVFDTMLDKALDLCGAAFGNLWTHDGKMFHAAAIRRVPKAYADHLSRRPIAAGPPGTVLGQIANGSAWAQVLDAAAEEAYLGSAARPVVELGLARTIAGVPLRKDGALLGTIMIYRQEVLPFSDKQIALLQNFAAQAVIAMENARLLTETREALEQQTATAEVLGVINASAGDLTPVFDAILEKAMRLCDAAFGSLYVMAGERLRSVAQRGVPEAYANFRATTPPSLETHGIVAEAIRTKRAVHVLDMRDRERYRAGYTDARAIVDLGGARSTVLVPLVKDDTFLGYISVFRQEVRAFSEKQMALLENFAAQAVIAMENARLLTETREALEQQTATAEVLQVINSTPGELVPVFDAMLDKAMRLCEAAFGIMQTYDGARFGTAAVREVPDALVEWRRRRGPLLFGPDTAPGRIVAGEDLVHEVDLMASDAYQRGNPDRRAIVDLGGARSHLIVALRKDGALLGTIAVYRQEVRPFDEKQIALLQNFAAQAVIAMENARLITETREALDQQTATAEVLRVINASPGDLAPVFDAILEKAHALCGARDGALVVRDGDNFRAVATHGSSEQLAAMLSQPFPPYPGGAQERLLQGGRLIHIPDQAASEQPNPIGRASVLGGTRTLLFIPLRKDGTLLGYITAARREVRPFSEKEITLLENFAAQAVIAMENARLITETREALEQQTATADVLGVINSSPGDLAPVFDAMLEKAIRLCGGIRGVLWTFEGERGRVAASRGLSADFVALLREHGESGTNPMLQRVMRGEHLFQINVPEHELYRSGDPLATAAFGAGVHTLIWVALVREGVAVGAFAIGRSEVRRFSDKEIALLQNFAAQAVIAMENARLLTETREALEQQTATAEVLRVINASPGDLVPVFEAILEKAHNLCAVAIGALEIWDGERVRAVATRGLPREFDDLIRQGYRPEPNDPHWALVDGRRFVHVPNLGGVDDPTSRTAAALVGTGTFLAVALRKDDTLLGRIVAARQEVRPFADKEIALLESFAAQAVIAMENARLLTELRLRTEELARRNSEYGERIEQQAATIDVLKVMSASPGDAQPVFQLIVERACAFCNADQAHLALVDHDILHLKATIGAGAAYPAQFPRPVDATSLFGRAIFARDTVQTPDVRTDPEHFRRALPEDSVVPVRAGVSVPLLHGGTPVGAIGLGRNVRGEFSATQVELLQTFAEQAVIAIRSAETYRELQERTAALAQRNSEYGERIEQQTATIDVLKAMSASPDDTQPVFDQIVSRAQELCNGWRASLFEFDGELVHHRAYTNANIPELEVAAYLAAFPMAPTRGSITCRAILDRQTIHIRDMDAETVMPAVRGLLHKSQLTIPLLRDNVAIGAITLAARERGGFSDSQVALLQTFAEQAVIAITSVANFRALRVRTAELTRSVAELQALEEVLRAVNSSLELETVLSTIISRAVQLSGADEGTVYEFDDAEQVFVPKSAYGMTAERVAALRDRRIRMGDETPLGRCAAMRAPLHVSDLTQTLDIDGSRTLVADGIHALLAVPLLRDDKVLGGLVIRRRAIGGFAPTVPTLLQTFAGQCVLAIENARLFQEARRARVEAETTLADLRRTQDRLVQSEKMASLGQLTAGIAHEIKNPLNFVNNFSELSVDLLDELHDAVAPDRLAVADGLRTEIDELTAMLKGNLEKIAEHGRRADSIVKNMLLHSRSGPGEHRLADLNATVEEALSLAYHGARAATPGFNITMETRLDPRAGKVHMYPQEITRVLLNLIGNGFYAAHKRAEASGNDGFEPTLQLTTRDLGDQVEIRVRDNGTGISEAARDRIFEPFFTTKPAGEGTGLGLSISYDIITQQHGGSIIVESEPGSFTEFTVRLPRQ